MEDWKDTALIGICVSLVLAFTGSLLFAMGSAFVAFGWWMLRLSGLVG
jgi:hypothetical protein